jgi:hypothetical protein
MAVELYITTKGESTVLAVVGEFDVEGLEELRSRLEHREQSNTRPVLDLRRILISEPEDARRKVALSAGPGGHNDIDA